MSPGGLRLHDAARLFDLLRERDCLVEPGSRFLESLDLRNSQTPCSAMTDKYLKQRKESMYAFKRYDTCEGIFSPRLVDVVYLLDPHLANNNETIQYEAAN